ncbi:MAG: DUF559 domain-containing protein [Eggerthellaceae bacterium]|nr:DUF559 domain-containing protein [Eggerthellaceae bacterium]
MNHYLSHQTARTFWLSPYAGRRDANPALPGLPSSLVPYHALDPELLSRYGLGQPPYHVTVAAAAQRCHNPEVISHVMGGAIPAGSFQPLRGELWIATPELTFCQVASHAGFTEAVKFGYELCSNFVLSELLASPDRREALSSPEMLLDYLKRSADRPGVKAARRAARYVHAGAESPMEIAVSMLLTLPRMYGGYGLPAAELNREIIVKSRIGGRQQTYRGDLVWPRQHVIVEYDSDLHHSRKAEISRDALRRNALQDAGWRVIVMTKDQVYDETAMDEAAAQLARSLGVHGNGTEPRAMLLRRGALRNLLLG